MSDVLMDKFEFRRLAFKRLVESFGRGGQARIAKEIGREASYISRMLYPTGRSGGKKIAEDSVELLNKHYPGWLDTDIESISDNVFANRRISERERTIQDVLRLLRETDLQGIEIVLHSASLMAEKYPISKQTASSQ